MSQEILTENLVSRILATVMVMFAPNDQPRAVLGHEIYESLSKLPRMRNIDFSVEECDLMAILENKKMRKFLAQNSGLWIGEVTTIPSYFNRKHFFKAFI